MYNLITFDTLSTWKTITTTQVMNISITPKSFLMPLGNPSPPISPHTPLSKELLIFFLQISLHFLKLLKNGIIQYAYFLDLASFPQYNYFEIHNIVACTNSLFLSTTARCMDVSQFVYPFTCRWIFGLFLVFGYYK